VHFNPEAALPTMHLATRAVPVRLAAYAYVTNPTDIR
jgi:hypothetical protein